MMAAQTLGPSFGTSPRFAAYPPFLFSFSGPLMLYVSKQPRLLTPLRNLPTPGFFSPPESLYDRLEIFHTGPPLSPISPGKPVPPPFSLQTSSCQRTFPSSTKPICLMKFNLLTFGHFSEFFPFPMAFSPLKVPLSFD